MNQPIAPVMSAISTFFRNLPETLQQPTSLALFGSVGAHVFFFASLPAFTSPPAAPDLRTVRMVELTPQEQSQLPQAPIASQFGLPPVPKANVKPIPSTNLPFSRSPLSDTSPLYRIPDLSIPAPSSLPAPPAIDFSRYLSPAKPPTPTFEGSTKLPALSALGSEKKPSQLAVPSSPQISSSTQTPAASLPNLTPAPPVLPSAPPPNTQNAPPSGTTQAATPQSASPDRLALETQRIRDLQQKVSYNPTGTDQNQGEFQKNYGNWIGSLDKRGVTDDKLEIIRQTPPGQAPLELPYPLSFPLRNFKQHTAVLGVLVAPDGKPVGAPEVIGSTGYKILNEAAVKAVEKQAEQYKPSEKYRAYLYELRFKPPTEQPTAASPRPQPQN